MAFAERRGKGWRGRYRRPDGTYGSTSGFDTKRAALQAAGDEESRIRHNTWIDPRSSRDALRGLREPVARSRHRQAERQHTSQVQAIPGQAVDSEVGRLADDRHLQQPLRHRSLGDPASRRLRGVLGRVVLRVLLDDHERCGQGQGDPCKPLLWHPGDRWRLGVGEVRRNSTPGAAGKHATVRQRTRIERLHARACWTPTPERVGANWPAKHFRSTTK